MLFEANYAKNYASILYQCLTVKAESEAERSDYQPQKNLQYAGHDGKDKEKETW